MVVRGAQLFAPYQRLGGWTARPPSPRQPHCPLLRDDPDHIRQVAAALAAALLNGQEPKPGRFSNGVLNHASTHPGPGRDLIDASSTLAMLAHFVPDDPQDRQLTNRELAGQRRRHGTGGGEVAASGNRDRALRGLLQPPRRENRRSADRN